MKKTYIKKYKKKFDYIFLLPTLNEEKNIKKLYLN